MLTALSLDDNEKALLDRVAKGETPDYRKAYSDRTAWLMSCFADAVYQTFGDLDAPGTAAFLEDRFETLMHAKTKPDLNRIVMDIHEREADRERTDKFVAEFQKYGMAVEEVYDHNDTQAMLISVGRRLVLAFRGTEASSLKDIWTDVYAIKRKGRTGGSIHSGFSIAFDQIAAKIKNDLKKPKYADMPIYITGHSLGGALASIATKQLTHAGGIAACYTFGSPRVGDLSWSYEIKTPIYRIVNAADGVPMLPLGMKINMPLLRWMSGFSHVGHAILLSRCKHEKQKKFDDAERCYGAGLIRRIVLAQRNPKSLFADHSMATYRKKLAVIATKRAKLTPETTSPASPDPSTQAKTAANDPGVGGKVA